eukprot:366150-Chlamydomonas_euryale.AAC.5
MDRVSRAVKLMCVSILDRMVRFDFGSCVQIRHSIPCTAETPMAVSMHPVSKCYAKLIME